ncbi:hypothetical protein Syun_026227 [Stephania yunnanensis]|uniref:Uncharacterized protein n=1 Tax=Stephania yunnanensis TaxID=152371 RepID=A0AAP0EYI3_9MAGN
MVTCDSSILDFAPGPSSSHYTSSSPPGHPYSYKHDTPSPPVHAHPAQHGIIPSSSHHFTPSPPTDGHPHNHGFRPSSSHHATPTPSAHPTHSLRDGDEHTSTSRRPPTPHRHSFVRSSRNRSRSSIPNAIEEIPNFSDLRQPLQKAKTLLFISLLSMACMLHPLSVATRKMSLVFKSGYLKEGWKWEYVPQSQRDIYWLRWKGGNFTSTIEVFFTWDLQMSFAIYDTWCRKAAIRYTGNIYLIAKKRITIIYLKDEVFEHYKRMRATDEAFKKKFEQMSTNKKSEVEGLGTGISLHSAGSISARQHSDTLVKGRVYGLGSQGYHRSISLGDASSSRGPAYGLHELEELQRDHQRLQETLLKERMERQEQMQRDKMERQEENREIQDRLARMEALLMQHLEIRPHVPSTSRTPPSPVTERSGPQSDDQPGHLTTEITPS